MKKSLFKTLFILAIVLIMVAGQAVTVFADDTSIANKKMAHNIYANPVTDGTSGRFTTFSIDFYSDETPNYTYWSLCNFGLGLTSIKTKLKYPGITGGGAYAGLQNTSVNQGKVSIMSVWEMKYKGTEILNVKQMYPEGDTDFGGEGEGKKCILSYDWADATWYRMVIHTWDDIENETTFLGQWIQNRETGEWHLACYYDTNIYESYISGGLSFFQENYVSGIDRWTQVRSFRLKNIYAHDYKDNAWKSLSSVNVSYGAGQDNKMGAHSFGATEEYIWGSAGGLVEGQDRENGIFVAPQEAYEAAAVKSKVYTINQPEQPTFGSPVLKTLTLEGNTISWEMSKTDTPQLSYKLEIIGVDGNVIATKEQTRPEITSVTVDGLTTDAYKAKLTVTDIFGATTVLEKTTEAYDKAPATPTDVPTPTPTPEETKTPETEAPAGTTSAPETNAPETEEPAGNTGVIIAIVAVALVAAAVVVFVVMKKKK